jgi:hypothetical protein
MVKTPTDETTKARRRNLGKIIAAVLVARPGAYSAVKTQYAADSEKVKATVTTDRKVADKVADELTKNVEANESELKVLRATCVSRKELLAIASRLRRRSNYPPRSPTRRTEVSAREAALQKQIDALKAKQAAGAKVVAKAKAEPKPRPKLRPAAAIRRQVQANAPAKGF